ncbi:hypothetical protein EJB05_13013 [Eragrostis curvula]|uniref:Uncharacterized protein n=1 Tax=Eragrostis curvula TaxID=38414 RepID=A0A5J9VVD8_9POAL|nr:hypothetical protein EJB05_13013 [Eragrostis curvula]
MTKSRSRTRSWPSGTGRRIVSNSGGYHADVPPTALRHLIISLDSGDIDAELGDGDALTAYDEALGLRGSDCLIDFELWFFVLQLKHGVEQAEQAREY